MMRIEIIIINVKINKIGVNTGVREKATCKDARV